MYKILNQYEKQSVTFTMTEILQPNENKSITLYSEIQEVLPNGLIDLFYIVESEDTLGDLWIQGIDLNGDLFSKTIEYTSENNHIVAITPDDFKPGIMKVWLSNSKNEIYFNKPQLQWYKSSKATSEFVAAGENICIYGSGFDEPIISFIKEGNEIAIAEPINYTPYKIEVTIPKEVVSCNIRVKNKKDEVWGNDAYGNKLQTEIIPYGYYRILKYNYEENKENEGKEIPINLGSKEISTNDNVKICLDLSTNNGGLDGVSVFGDENNCLLKITKKGDSGLHAYYNNKEWHARNGNDDGKPTYFNSTSTEYRFIWQFKYGTAEYYKYGDNDLTLPTVSFTKNILFNFNLYPNSALSISRLSITNYNSIKLVDLIPLSNGENDILYDLLKGEIKATRNTTRTDVLEFSQGTVIELSDESQLASVIANCKPYTTINFSKCKNEIKLNNMIEINKPIKFLGNNNILRFQGETKTDKLDSNSLFYITCLPFHCEGITFKLDRKAQCALYVHGYVNKYDKQNNLFKGYNGLTIVNCKFENNNKDGPFYYYGHFNEELNNKKFIPMSYFDEVNKKTVINYYKNPIKIAEADNIEIKNCYFNSVGAIELGNIDKGIIANNELCGNSIMGTGTGNALSSFIHSPNGVSNIDISNNKIYGEQSLENNNATVGNKVINRAMVLQGTFYNAYIANNTTKCVGQFGTNTGEQFLLESPIQLNSIQIDKNNNNNKLELPIIYQNNRYETNGKAIIGSKFIRVGNNKYNIKPSTVLDIKSSTSLQNYECLILDNPLQDNNIKEDDFYVLLTPFENITFYNNIIEGFDNYDSDWSAMAGIQIYGSSLNCHIDGNRISKVQTGIYPYCRFCIEDGELHSRDQNLEPTQENKGKNTAQNEFAYIYGLYIKNNIIRDCRNGIFVYNCQLPEDGTAAWAEGYPSAVTARSIVIKNNSIINMQNQQEPAHYGGEEGGIGIKIGAIPRLDTTCLYTSNWQYVNAWIQRSLIENNILQYNDNNKFILYEGQYNTMFYNNKGIFEAETVQGITKNNDGSLTYRELNKNSLPIDIKYETTREEKQQGNKPIWFSNVEAYYQYEIEGKEIEKGIQTKGKNTLNTDEEIKKVIITYYK